MIQLVFTASGHFVGQADIEVDELSEEENIPAHVSESNIIVIVGETEEADSVREIFERGS